MDGDGFKGWVDIAARGLERLATAAEHGSTMARRARVAEELGVSRQTLRNYIDCLRFVLDVDAVRPEAGIALRRFAATIVAVYSRWFRYDPDGALDHAIAAQGLPATRIIAAEKAARRRLVPNEPSLLDRAMQGATGQAGPILAHAFALGRATGIVPRLEELSIVENGDPLSAAMGAPRVLSGGDGGTIVPVIELDRGSVGDGHRRSARATLARAALAAARHPLVIVLLPDRAAVEEYLAFLPPIDDFVVRSGPPVLHVFADGLGAVATMSADRFVPDWTAG